MVHVVIEDCRSKNKSISNEASDIMTSSGRPAERRLFSRVRCSQTANLRHGDRVCQCNLLDVSLNGALFEVPPELTVQSGAEIKLEVVHPETNQLTIAEAIVVHVKSGRAGCRFTEIDSESIDNLREFVVWLVTSEGDTRG
jgi:hypothetical protein